MSVLMSWRHVVSHDTHGVRIFDAGAILGDGLLFHFEAGVSIQNSSLIFWGAFNTILSNIRYIIILILCTKKLYCVPHAPTCPCAIMIMPSHSYGPITEMSTR